MLTDFAEGSDRSVRVRVRDGPCGLAFRFDGYGDVMEEQGGIPMVIEVFDGVLSVIIWGDINDEEPTHKISLEGAREELRKPIDDQARV